MRWFPEAPTVEAFLDACKHTGHMLDTDEVRRAWLGPSVLKKMTVGDIAGHMFLIVRRVGKHIEDSPLPSTTAPAAIPRTDWTWMRLETGEDLDRLDHRQVRVDAAHVARWGWEAVQSAFNARVRHVSGLLERGCPPELNVSGHRLPFSTYLATRVVELIVHTDDLVSSVGLSTALPSRAVTVAVDALVDGARSVHGDLAVLRALSRAERAPSDISVF